MRKRLLFLLFICITALGGCKNASDSFLLYQDTVKNQETLFNTQLAQTDFFAEDLTIVTEKENVSGDKQLTAGAALLIDKSDQKVLYADGTYNKLYPASLTKLLTALVVLKYGELTDSVTIGNNAVNISEIGAKMCGFKEGDVISLEALLHCMLVYSGNDAAIAAAEHVGKSEEEFVKMMNKEAIRIGAVHSNFVNANGLHDDNQYTTAYDLYLIFDELLKYDTFRNIISSASYTADYTDKNGNAIEKTYNSTNQYLDQEKEAPELKVIGGKTGTTNKAGNCLIILTKDKKDKEYISIILKAENNDELYSQMTYLLSMAVK